MPEAQAPLLAPGAAPALPPDEAAHLRRAALALRFHAGAHAKAGRRDPAQFLPLLATALSALAAGDGAEARAQMRLWALADEIAEARR